MSNTEISVQAGQTGGNNQCDCFVTGRTPVIGKGARRGFKLNCRV